MLSCVILIIVTISYSLLAAQADLRHALPIMLGVTAVVIGFLCFTVYVGEKGYVKWSPGFVLTLTLIFGLLFLFRQPELSDDI
ncbi:MAG: hypothetical protein SWO11_01065 [Thermodesulfobacteriota bacterium]|nr:hypothetical protein [Thermodesulfobacteriota bacterium]